ncbi:MAG: BLUF domain-containing protein, partial [Xylophilus ampelinus]
EDRFRLMMEIPPASDSIPRLCPTKARLPAWTLNAVHHCKTMSASLIRTIYVSCSSMPPSWMPRMLERSKLRNAACDITSGLLATPQYFCQVVEGPNPVVRELIDRIRGDAHHHSMKVVFQEAVVDRTFSGLPMAFAEMPQLEPIVAPLFSIDDAGRARMLGAMLRQALSRQTLVS